MKNNQIFEHYVLMWSYGIHHQPIETTEECFHRVLDDMSTEFKIYRIESYKTIVQPDKADSHIFEVEYSFENYYGDKEVLGACTKPV